MSLSLLTLGGIAALVASGWAQVKNVFSYLSSFIIVTSEIDGLLERPVTYYLRQEWKLLPSGKLVYRSRTLWMHRLKKIRIVPFRLPANNAIYYSGRKILFVSRGGKMKISFLRGSMNSDDFISAALDHANVRSDFRKEEQDKESLFRVETIIGAEKSGKEWERSGRGRQGLNSVSPSDDTIDGGREEGEILSDTLDKSFKYASDEWMFQNTTNPFDSLYYPPHVEKYIQQAERWKEMETWYTDREIPWRRGWLLHGGPGTGKTSLSKAVAQRLGIPMYIYQMNTLSDQEFMENWEKMSGPCMAVFEDFDNVFHGRTSQTEHKLLSFDCVLNTVGGAKSTHGIFLVITTNDLSKIDIAMGVSWGTDGNKSGISSRPGRVDSVIELGPMEVDGRTKLAKRILRDWPEVVEDMVLEGEGCSPVQFQEMCLQYALARIEKDIFQTSAEACVSKEVAMI